MDGCKPRSFPPRARAGLEHPALIAGVAVFALAPIFSSPARADGPPLAASGGSRWSPFAPIAASVPPSIADEEWSGDPIDAFVRARLVAAGLDAAREVGKRAWIRRVTFDLTGLPPSPEDVEAFVRDSRSDALARERVVDRLLASPRFGERMARHWLDVVRYAESDGFAIDSERPTLWRYRDWVVRSFNADRPFDELVRLQIAGDEFDPGAEGAIATGFYRLGPFEADNMVPEERHQDYLNEITTAIGSTFLGLTLGCARCHDHKYDPLPTADYYGLQAFVAPVRREERAAPFLPGEKTAALEARRGKVEREIAELRSKLDAVRDAMRRSIFEARRRAAGDGAPDPAAGAPTGPALDSAALAQITDEDIKKAIEAGDGGPVAKELREKHAALEKAINENEDAQRVREVAVTIAASTSRNDAPPATHVLIGGRVTARGEETPPHFLTAIRNETSAELSKRLDEVRSTSRGRRSVLADWLASPSNPLTARVFVNRLWQWTLGRGIVATPNDLGVNGADPTHPELLDRLAHDFIEGGFRTKPIVRRIVLSRAYRTSTEHAQYERAVEVDPENRTLWRGQYRRLEAEEIRDAMLFASGELRGAIGGPSFFAAIPEELGTSFPFFEWHASDAQERRRRSLYIFQRRNLVLPLFESFDAADMTESCERRSRSVTTTQVFHLLNGRSSFERSRSFADRVIAECGNDANREIDRAFRIAFSRPPREEELVAARRFLDEQASAILSDSRASSSESAAPSAPSEGDLAESARRAHREALADLALALFNANEFVYIGADGSVEGENATAVQNQPDER